MCPHSIESSNDPLVSDTAPILCDKVELRKHSKRQTIALNASLKTTLYAWSLYARSSDSIICESPAIRPPRERLLFGVERKRAFHWKVFELIESKYRPNIRTFVSPIVVLIRKSQPQFGISQRSSSLLAWNLSMSRKWNSVFRRRLQLNQLINWPLNSS